MRRWAAIGLLLFGSLVIQQSVFPSFRLMGALPELVLAAAILVALNLGPGTGAASGFAGGLLLDLYGSHTAGLAALAFTVVGYLAGRTERMMMRSSFWILPALVFGFTQAGEVLYVLLGYVTGNRMPLGTVVPAALYTALVSPALAPVVHKLAEIEGPVRDI